MFYDRVMDLDSGGYFFDADHFGLGECPASVWERPVLTDHLQHLRTKFSLSLDREDTFDNT